MSLCAKKFDDEMAICPRCKKKISWIKFLILAPDNIKTSFICSHCKAYLIPKHWILINAFNAIIICGLAVFFQWLNKSFQISSQVLIIIWIILTLLSRFVFWFAEFNDYDLKK